MVTLATGSPCSDSAATSAWPPSWTATARFSSGSPMYLGGEEVRSRPYAEATQRVIDQEVGGLLREAERRALSLLSEHRSALDRLADLLLERETVDGTDVDEVLGRVPGRRQPVGATGHAATEERTAAPGA